LPISRLLIANWLADLPVNLLLGCSGKRERRELRGWPIKGYPADYEAIRERLTALDAWLSTGGASPTAGNLAHTTPN
jgi:hypothetical protein